VDAAARGLLELGIALGVLALAVLGLQFVLAARLAPLTRALGARALRAAHRRSASVLVALVAGHVVLLVAAGSPGAAHRRGRAGASTPPWARSSWSGRSRTSSGSASSPPRPRAPRASRCSRSHRRSPPRRAATAAAAGP